MPLPIRGGTPGVQTPGVQTPSTTPTPATTPSTPATPARPANWTGPAGPAVRDAFNAVGNAVKNAGPSDYDLVPGRYPDAVPLPVVLSAVGQSPQGQAALNKVLDQFKARTGIDVPPETRSAVLSNPAALAKALEVSPAELSAGMVALNGAYKAGKMKDAAQAAPILPQHFDLSKLDDVDAPRGKGDLKELAPGLFQGSLPSSTSDAQVKRNKVLAEVFDRLSKNPGVPGDQQFSVKYGGKDFTNVEGFVKQLAADGYQVDVHFDARIANFADLKTVVPNSNPPQFVDVPAPLMVKTGIKDGLGKEAIVPAVHSEMIVSIKAGPNAKGPKFDADLKYYQGVSGTGFFPCNVSQEPSWCGRVSHDPLSGDQALKAITLAGAFTDVVNTTAKEKKLYAAGYGITGVCNDSVALIQQAMTGKADAYPLLMQDQVLNHAITERLSDGNKADDANYRALRTAMKELPNDLRHNDSQKRRALASLPWAAGREPFVSSEEARRILSQ
ncbi:MAG: hypothetical protein U0228_04520 [Myxococcaceae bacterium]